MNSNFTFDLNSSKKAAPHRFPKQISSFLKEHTTMLDLILQDLLIEDLAQLRQELNDFFAAYNSYQWLYCEGDGGADSADRNAALKAELLRHTIRGIAIDWGIHKEFLSQYEDLRQTIAKKALEPQAELAPF